MSELSFKYCPVCSAELETGKVAFPPSRQLFMNDGAYYSDEITEELDGQLIKQMLRKPDKTFSLEQGAENPAGYCRKCGKIFSEFYVIGSLIEDGMLLTDGYNESADSLYEDNIISYEEKSYDEKYNTIGGYTIITDNKKFNKSED